MADTNSLKFKLRLALHEALGGNGWAYSNWASDELNILDTDLDHAVEGVISALIANTDSSLTKSCLQLVLLELESSE